MRRAIIVCLAILLMPTAVQAQAPAKPPAQQDKLTPNPGLVARMRWVQFNLVNGRIVATTVNVGNSYTQSLNGPDRKEQLTLNLTTGTPSLRYELKTSANELDIDLVDGDQFDIKRTRNGENGAKIEFRQAPGQPLSLKITDKSGERTATAPTLWHLLLEEPEVGKHFLASTLEVVKPAWQLANTADQIELALIHNARVRDNSQRARWQAWVSALASTKFSERESAERKLLESGREVLPYLHGLQRASLDAEQWRRVRNLIASLDGEQADSVEQTVSQLSGDPRAWIALLNREDESKRRIAFEQLELVTGETLDFDPSAAAEIRKKQLAKLRERFKTEPVVEDSDVE